MTQIALIRRRRIKNGKGDQGSLSKTSENVISQSCHLAHIALRKGGKSLSREDFRLANERSLVSQILDDERIASSGVKDMQSTAGLGEGERIFLGIRHADHADLRAHILPFLSTVSDSSVLVLLSLAHSHGSDKINLPGTLHFQEELPASETHDSILWGGIFFPARLSQELEICYQMQDSRTNLLTTRSNERVSTEFYLLYAGRDA